MLYGLQGNDIIAAAKKMAFLMAKMSSLVGNANGKKSDMIRFVVRLCYFFWLSNFLAFKLPSKRLCDVPVDWLFVFVLLKF